MKCIHCQAEIENDDNFCPICGHWTSHGYMFLKDKSNVKMIINGSSIKQQQHFSILISLLCFGVIIFCIMTFIRGQDLLKPITYLKKQFTSYIYGYNSSVIKTDNKYSHEKINSYQDAIEFIKKDFNKQSYMCYKDNQLSKLEYELENEYLIPSVLFCDMPLNEALKIKNVIAKMYDLFPNIKGTLTNITITNPPKDSFYIARFQPMYQFVNINDNIKKYNKVNKTQILLNSYYFLNEDILEKKFEEVIGDNWYVNDATWESIIAHEIGHYISFTAFLKEHNLTNITYITLDNYNTIDFIMKEYDNGEFSKNIINEALTNYNLQYNTNLDISSFAISISNYAAALDDKNNLIADEIIAEAIHDYYLHGDTMKNSSNEIIKIIKGKLGYI